MTISRNISVMAQGASTAGVLSGAYGGSLTLQAVQSSNFAAVAGSSYQINTTSGAVTVTLPASPTAGQVVQITDYAGTFATNNCTIDPNGGKIRSSTSNFPLSIPRESVTLIYVDSTQGWAFTSGIIPASVYSAPYLAVAGGGGSGYSRGAGGGAGGLLSGTVSLVAGSVYTVTVGAGGAGSSGAAGTATNGANSSLSGSGITTVTSVGGGKGSDGGVVSAGSGGSGGGGATVSGASQAGGSGTSGQGNAGGASASGAFNGAGGGGGAGAVGASASTDAGGNGGAGTASSITGSSVTYAGGGGGGSNNNAVAGTGGAGGGGNGGASSNAAGSPGTANTGGGGGGGRNNTVATNGGAGGSGVVILSIPSSSYSGVTTGSPTITSTAGYTILKFTASGSYTA